MSWEDLCTCKDAGSLSFQKIRLFNIAMFAKQGWHFMTNSISLVSQIFKAHYYPHCSFLESELRNNPNFTWCSIWQAGSLLKIGSHCRIGDGCSTLIWHDS